VRFKKLCFINNAEKFTESSEIGNFLAHHTLYTMPGLSVSMGPILHENLDKTRRTVTDSWRHHAEKKATQHFDNLFLAELNKLAGNT
jgi:hypothetical protein